MCLRTGVERDLAIGLYIKLGIQIEFIRCLSSQIGTTGTTLSRPLSI